MSNEQNIPKEVFGLKYVSLGSIFDSTRVYVYKVVFVNCDSILLMANKLAEADLERHNGLCQSQNFSMQCEKRDGKNGRICELLIDDIVYAYYELLPFDCA